MGKKHYFFGFSVLTFGILFLSVACSKKDKTTENIPLPEHPRPDKERAEWINLNGYWQFENDSADVGISESWFNGRKGFTQKILVPFPWGSPLSEVENQADIAWYKRSMTIPEEWNGKRVFLIVGASDWLTKGWIDGKEIGQYQGGYTPFEFELTGKVESGGSHEVILRVDDSPHDFKLFGKQGYGDAKGIWQTVYLEARPEHYIADFYFTPDIDNARLFVKAVFDKPLEVDSRVSLKYKGKESNYSIGEGTALSGSSETSFVVDIPNPVLWTLKKPHLYDVEIILEGESPDVITTYFGMRKISVVNLPGTDIPYVALNNKPIYIQTTLDQAYHPEGFYTFPTDEFIRDEIWRAKEIGLNGQRVHIKVPIPRKLYWADRLGHLIMADVPNSWGEPDSAMHHEIKVAMEGMIARDYNHPSIYSWVLFNETWGLFSTTGENERKYLPETRQWVASMYHHAKSLDSTRLVEDNSACNYDHVISDINTWHAYLPGYAWKGFLDNATEQTFPGSPWNYVDGYTQTNIPMFNSECGNVWGYDGSTGDVDWSWDYHIMMNEFRRHPKVAGWLYTEHHDVINEWNGYWKFDRTNKFTGFEELVEGMSLKDMHSLIYLAPAFLDMETVVGEEIPVPVRLSVMTDQAPADEVDLNLRLYGWNTLGQPVDVWSEIQKITIAPWEQRDLESINVKMPQVPGLYILSMQLVGDGEPIHSNFTVFKVIDTVENPAVITFRPDSFTKQEWSLKQWNILDGLKVNGAGVGYFEYDVPIPEGMDISQFSKATFKAELSSKPLNGKVKEEALETNSDYMRGMGLHDPGRNPNSYPMTDEYPNPSKVIVSVNGTNIGEADLPDDPADHRGILSWHSQLRDKKLREAGTFGYLIELPIDKAVIQQAIADGKLIIRLQVDESLPGGLAIYGKDFGRYPLDPTIVFE